MIKSSSWSVALAGVLVLIGAGPGVESPVADAAMRRDTELVRELLRAGEDVNAAQGDGMTALHWASEVGSSEMAEILLYAGANLEAVTRLGDYTPLHLAAKGGRGDVVAQLLEAGADPEAMTSTGSVRALHFAAAAGDLGAVRSLVERGAAVDSRETSWGQTPLMFAASRNRLEVVGFLVDSGADLAARSKVLDVQARSAENRAAGQIRDQVLDAFRAEAGSRAEGWRPDPSQVQAAVRAARQGDGPEALREADEPTASEASAYSSSFTALVGAQGGLTPLLHATREGHRDVALALIDGGADLDQVSGGDRTSPMLIATINGHFDLALELLRLGADPGLASAAGTTPLYAAINAQWAPKARYPQQEAYRQQEATYLDVMKAMLEAGADPNTRLAQHLWYMEYTFSHLGLDTRGATAFWRAAHGLDVEAMRLLVEYGADVTIATVRPPARGRFNTLGRGAPDSPEEPAPPPVDPSGLPPVPNDGPGMAPIHAASGHGYGTGYAGNSHRHVPDGWLETVRYLVEEHGADVNAPDHNGYTPLHNAASRGDVEMIEYLVEHGADVKAVSRRGQTTADMANGPQQRIQPFPEAIAVLVKLGAVNNHNCRSCQ